MSRNLIVAGYGPGISHAVAERFGQEGFTVALVGRTLAKLEAGVKALAAKGVTARAFVGDFSTAEGARAAVQAVRAALGPIAALEWTAYATGAGDLTSATAADLRGVLEVATSSLLGAVQEALVDLRAAKGAVLVTNGGLGAPTEAVDAIAVSWNAMGLAVANAAKHKLVRVLHRKLQADGVYVGEVMVTGTVKGTAFDRGQATIAAATVAQRFWDLYQARAEVSVTV